MNHSAILFRLLLPLVALTYWSCNDPTSSNNSEKAITAFSFDNPAVVGSIDENAKTISILVPNETNVRSLTAIFSTTGVSVSIGSVQQTSGLTVNDFSSPVIYTVTANDNSKATYTVNVYVATRNITSFSFPAIGANGSIDEANKTILIAVPGATDLTAMVASFVTNGVSVSVGSTVQVTGVTANNFTNPVVYTVTSSDGNTGIYTVSVIKSVQANWNIFDWTDTVIEPTGWLNRDGMNTYCTVTNGILSFDSKDVLNSAHYRFQFTQPFEPGWKMTLVFKARGDGDPNSLAWTLDFNNNYRGQVEIRNGQVSLKNGTGTVGSVIVTSSVMHTYLVSFEIITSGVRMSVYIDGRPTADLSHIVNAPANGVHIRLGDLSGNNTFKGSLDWIAWTIDGAYFPGSVDLPSGYSLNP